MTAVVSCDSKSPADAFVADPAALKRGKSIFIGTCGGYCHSTVPGPRDAPFLFDCVWIHGGSDQEIFATVSNGVPNTAMVSFSGMLPEGDDDIWRVIAYLGSERGVC
jgi:mono/diheme cytochrome c family protein